ncbi:MAG TPA: gluconokinase [Terriglobales bacterium]|nr:gluconokinase [Terriglobales bacterium]
MIIILMGASGSGKTIVGQKLAHDLGWEFVEGDDYHPKSNIEKMVRGEPLDDQDRAPWLAALRHVITARVTARQNVIIACSALKTAYRDELKVAPEVKIVYLKGSASLLKVRLENRKGHYMKSNMLQSQLEALEEPTDALTVDVTGTVDDIVMQIRRGLGI